MQYIWDPDFDVIAAGCYCKGSQDGTSFDQINAAYKNKFPHDFNQ